jgi:hypothetical protein
VVVGLGVIVAVFVGNGVIVGCCVGVELGIDEGEEVGVCGIAERITTFRVCVRSGVLVIVGEAPLVRAKTTTVPIDINRHKKAITQYAIMVATLRDIILGFDKGGSGNSSSRSGDPPTPSFWSRKYISTGSVWSSAEFTEAESGILGSASCEIWSSLSIESRDPF